jgi:hypothetical protein
MLANVYHENWVQKVVKIAGTIHIFLECIRGLLIFVDKAIWRLHCRVSVLMMSRHECPESQTGFKMMIALRYLGQLTGHTDD